MHDLESWRPRPLSMRVGWLRTWEQGRPTPTWWGTQLSIIYRTRSDHRLVSFFSLTCIQSVWQPIIWLCWRLSSSVQTCLFSSDTRGNWRYCNKHLSSLWAVKGFHSSSFHLFSLSSPLYSLRHLLTFLSFSFLLLSNANEQGPSTFVIYWKKCMSRGTETNVVFMESKKICGYFDQH